MSEALGPPVTEPRAGRGAAFGDVDNDGDVDVLVNNVHDTPDLFRTRADPAHHWILVKLEGTKSNRSAIGARVRVDAAGASQWQEVRGGGSYISQNDLRVHFGLGAATRVDRLEVRWPNGLVEQWRDLPADRVHRLVEGTAGRALNAPTRASSSPASPAPCLRRPGTPRGRAGARRRRQAAGGDRAAQDAARRAIRESRTCWASRTTTRATPAGRSRRWPRSRPGCRPARPSRSRRRRCSASASTSRAASRTAVPHLERTRAALPGNTDIAYVLGMALVKTGQPAKARAVWSEAFAVKPDTAAAHLLTAQMMVRAELDEPAEAELKQALAKEPALPRAHFLLGQTALFRGRVDEAVALFQRELEIAPGDAMALYRLGDAYRADGRWDDATAALQRSIWVNPFYSGPYILLGKAHQQRGNLAAAEAMWRRAIEYDPKNKAAHYLLAQLLQRTGRAEEARREFATAEQLIAGDER